jgi:catalase
VTTTQPKPTTTDAGIPVESDEHSLTVGPHGPILLQMVNNIVGHLLKGVSDPTLQRAFEYWCNVDKDLGDRVEQEVRAKQSELDPKAAEQANLVRSGAQAKA